MGAADFQWKDAFAAIAAFVGMISALVTALGAVAAYKLKRAEKPKIEGVPVTILSLKERRSLNWSALIVKIFGYATIILGIPFVSFVIWSVDFEMSFVVASVIGYLLITAIYLFLIWKLRGDTSQRRSRTRYDTTIVVKAPYEMVFAKCKEAVLRLKGRIISLDFEKGTIESERTSAWHVPFILNVKISSLDPQRCSIHVESDAILPTVLFDFGTNSRRVNRFMHEITR
jgi:hypothetical protein